MTSNVPSTRTLLDGRRPGCGCRRVSGPHGPQAPSSVGFSNTGTCPQAQVGHVEHFRPREAQIRGNLKMKEIVAPALKAEAETPDHRLPSTPPPGEGQRVAAKPQVPFQGSALLLGADALEDRARDEGRGIQRGCEDMTATSTPPPHTHLVLLKPQVRGRRGRTGASQGTQRESRRRPGDTEGEQAQARGHKGRVGTGQGTQRESRHRPRDAE